MDLDEKYMKSIVDKSRESSGEALHYLGKIQIARGEVDAAIKTLERSWSVYRNTMGIYHVQTSHVILDLARAYHLHGGMIQRLSNS